MTSNIYRNLPDFIETFELFDGTEAGAIFVRRVAGIDVRANREEALARLEGVHRTALSHMNLDDRKLIRAEGVHGQEVAIVRDSYMREPVPDVDALITARRNVLLGVYVADCCAVYVHDPVHNIVGLAHSGRKGTELNVVGNMLGVMKDEFGSRPADLLAQLSPCIRPPFYEVDFAEDIKKQLKEAGVREIADPGTCTAENWDQYYSYRREKGKTGRMLAVAWLKG